MYSTDTEETELFAAAGGGSGANYAARERHLKVMSGQNSSEGVTCDYENDVTISNIDGGAGGAGWKSNGLNVIKDNG